MGIFKLTMVTVFAALLKKFSIDWTDNVLTDSLLKTHSFNCLTFEEYTRKLYNDNLSLFRTLALHLHGNERLDQETAK